MTRIAPTLLFVVLITFAGCDRAADQPTLSTPPSEPTNERSPGQIALAESAYRTQCLTCHGPNGRGDGNLVPSLPIKPRSFAEDEWRFVDFSKSDAEIRKAVETVLRQGIKEAMMPGYDRTLTDAQILALVDHVLEMRKAR